MSQLPVFLTNEYHARDERIANEKSLDKYACLCKKILSGKMRRRQMIFEHMLRFSHRGISHFPQNSYWYSIPLRSMGDIEAQNIDEEATNSDEEATMLDEGVEIDIMVNEGFKDD